MLTVKGIDSIDDISNTFKDVDIVYNFFDFKSSILDYSYAFNVTFKFEFYYHFYKKKINFKYAKVPRGVYCPGVPFSTDLPPLKRQYQFTEEIILPNGQVLVSKVF